MNIEGIFSEAGLLNNEGLALLFRYGVRKHADKEARQTLKRVEKRFGLKIYLTSHSGLLSDAVLLLKSLDENERFETVCNLILAANVGKVSIDPQLNDDIIQLCRSQDIVRFSFEGSMLICLVYGRALIGTSRMARTVEPIRYAGIGSDVHLMAFASIFLGLPTSVEVGPPWQPDMLFDFDEPIIDLPNLEISFPPAVVYAKDSGHLEDSIRSCKLPRAVDRGKYDVESVMLQYLENSSSAAIAFVSQEFLTTPKLSRYTARNQLLKSSRLRRVTELVYSQPKTAPEFRFAVELNPGDEFLKLIQMTRVQSLLEFRSARARQMRGKNQRVTIDDIALHGKTLLPSRFLGVGPVDADTLSNLYAKMRKPGGTRLADLFEVIRPKTTRHESQGELTIHEVRAGDITEQGEISKASRQICVRETIGPNLASQELRTDDILLAHKGPVGRVAYIDSESASGDQDARLWAAQSILVLRARKQQSAQAGSPTCDPKIMFMYLLSPQIRKHWQEASTNVRSPSLSIANIERLEIIEPLLKLKGKSPAALAHTEKYSGFQKTIVKKFDSRRAKLAEIAGMKSQMETELDEVSKAIFRW